MKIRSAQELMKENLLVKHYAGSHSYGTALPDSDVDFRGIFCADRVNLLTPFFPVREVEDTTEEDTKFYELAHFMKLCLDCNPNIVETLWVSNEDIVTTSDAYQHLRDNRQKLLSSKIAFTTSGYALAQLKRIKGHNKWINSPQPEEPPKPRDFVSIVQWFGQEKRLHLNIMDFNDDHRFVPYGGNIYGVYRVNGHTLFDNAGNLNNLFEGNREDLDVRELDVIAKWNKEEYKTAKEHHNLYWTWKRNRNKKRSVLEKQFGYDCYSDDTEFLTNNGWKSFDEVDDNDSLATFNQYSHQVEFQPPTERIESLYTGNMYHFTGHHTDCLVTANHNMLVRSFSRTTGKEGRWEFHRAGELPETFDTLTSISPRKNRQILPKGFPIGEITNIKVLDFLRLVGWYISDGTMSFYEDQQVKTMRLSQSKPQSKLTQTLTKQRNAGKIECNHYLCEARGLGNHPENIWTFPRHISQTIYRACGHGSHSKRLPSWSFFLTKREMTTLLIALLQGDGSKRNHQDHTYVYYTCNYDLAGDVQRLALMCGFETSLYGPYEQMYHVHINMRPTPRRTSRQRVEKIHVQNQRIVCFMVPNLTLITRRNGQIGLHANTKHAMHLVRLLRMGVEALRDGEIVVKRPDAEQLLEIRNGSWTYEEIVKYAESMDKEVREVWYKKTSLPKKPDIKFAAKLLMEVQNLIWRQNDNTRTIV